MFIVGIIAAIILICIILLIAKKSGRNAFGTLVPASRGPRSRARADRIKGGSPVFVEFQAIYRVAFS